MTFGFALCALAVATGSTVETRQDTDTRSIRDGVFSAEQVTRGEEIFGQVCSSCHTPRDYTGANFMSLWSGASVFEFFDFLRFTMPEDQPPLAAVPGEDWTVRRSTGGDRVQRETARTAANILGNELGTCPHSAGYLDISRQNARFWAVSIATFLNTIALSSATGLMDQLWSDPNQVLSQAKLPTSICQKLPRKHDLETTSSKPCKLIRKVAG